MIVTEHYIMTRFPFSAPSHSLLSRVHFSFLASLAKWLILEWPFSKNNKEQKKKKTLLSSKIPN